MQKYAHESNKKATLRPLLKLYNYLCGPALQLKLDSELFTQKKKVEGSSFRNYAKCACAAFHHWEGNACVPFQWFSRLYSDWFSTFEIVSDNPSIIWRSQIPSLMHRNYQTTQSLQPLTRKQCGLPFQFLSFQVWSGFSSLSIFHWILYAGSVFDISTYICLMSNNWWSLEHRTTGISYLHYCNQHSSTSSTSPSPHVHTSNFSCAATPCQSPLAPMLHHFAEAAATVQRSSDGGCTTHHRRLPRSAAVAGAAAQRSSGGRSVVAQHANLLPRLAAQRLGDLKKKCMGTAGPGEGQDGMGGPGREGEGQLLNSIVVEALAG